MIDSLPHPLVFHNVREKIYPDGTIKQTICTDPIFKEDGWEERCREPPSTKVSKPKNMANDVREDSVRRAKQKVFDISFCNEFDYFVTWTLNEEKIDRFGPKEISKKLKTFLRNMVERNDLRYLVIPEHHKDGAIHMHALISGDIKLVDSGRRTKDKKHPENHGKVIYNMPQWKLGFSTAIPITGDRANVSKYVTKYISKDFCKIFGSFYYAGGKGLKRSPEIRLFDVDFNSVDAKVYEKPYMAFKYITKGVNDDSKESSSSLQEKELVSR